MLQYIIQYNIGDVICLSIIITISLLFKRIYKHNDENLNIICISLWLDFFSLIFTLSANIVLETLCNRNIYNILYILAYTFLIINFPYFHKYIDCYSDKKFLGNKLMILLGGVNLLWPIYAFISNDINSFAIIYMLNIILLGIHLMQIKDVMLVDARMSFFWAIAVACMLVIIPLTYFRTRDYVGFSFLLPTIIALIMNYTRYYNFETGSLNSEQYEKDFTNLFINEKNRFKKNDIYFLWHFYCSKNKDDELPKDVLSLFKNALNEDKFLKKYELYKISNNHYALIVPRTTNCTIDYIKDFIFNFENKLIEYKNTTFLVYKFVIYEINSSIEYETSLEHIKRTKRHFRTQKINSIDYVSKDDVSKWNRYKYIYNLLTNIYTEQNLNDERVLPYFQPIKNIETGKFSSAEALMRINDEKLGIIQPYEVIPIIEEMNYIHVFSKIMLNKVCEALNNLDSNKIDRISVNFSIQELNEKNFIDDLVYILNNQNNKVDYSKIGIEFTETQTNLNFELVLSTIRTLNELGFVTYLDDFGTGYSNFDKVLNLPMKIVKMDKTLLYMGEKNKQMGDIIHSFCNTFKNLGCKILFEGVETDMHENLCMQNKVDYLQGYKYSKPIPFDEYKEFLNKYN